MNPVIRSPERRRVEFDAHYASHGSAEMMSCVLQTVADVLRWFRRFD